MEFVGGPLDGERHEIGEAVGQVTRMVDVQNLAGESMVMAPPAWVAVTYEKRESPATGRTRMIFTGFHR